LIEIADLIAVEHHLKYEASFAWPKRSGRLRRCMPARTRERDYGAIVIQSFQLARGWKKASNGGD
jgi:hypothetical protein